MNLSIVIVNWNAGAFLEQCLQSVYAFPPLGEFEIIVVDNASTDNSVTMLRPRFPQVHLIENHENLGFARANNQALGMARGEFLLLLNPDAEVQRGALPLMVQFMQTHSKVGAVGAQLIDPHGNTQASCHPYPTLGRELWRLFHLDQLFAYAIYPRSFWHGRAPQKVDSVQGACMLLRRQALEQVGWLDEGYFMFTEEVDLCYRLHRAGWEVYWLPGARVVHYGGGSTRQQPLEMFLELNKSKMRFFRKHYGSLSAGLYRLILLAATLARLISCALPLWRSWEAQARRDDLRLRYRILLPILLKEREWGWVVREGSKTV